MKPGRAIASVVVGSLVVAAALVVACVGEEPDLDRSSPDAAVTADTGLTTDGGAPAEDASAGDAPSSGGDAGERSVRCGAGQCTGGDVCCYAYDASTAECTPATACADPFGPVACDDPSDCAAGQRCCGGTFRAGDDGVVYVASQCRVIAPGEACAELELCAAPSQCPAPFTACDLTAPDYHPGFKHCR